MVGDDLRVGPEKLLAYVCGGFLQRALVLGLGDRSRRSPLGYVALASVSGYMAWGLSEYAFHRWLYHQPHCILGDGHRIHHENPSVLIVMPWFRRYGATQRSPSELHLLNSDFYFVALFQVFERLECDFLYLV